MDYRSLKIVENKQDKDLKIHTDRRLLANLSDTMLVDKEQKMAVAIDVAIRADSEITQMSKRRLTNTSGWQPEPMWTEY